MRTRHRPPSLVSMWMLDVFCCALGCVILLLLLKWRETGIIAEESAQASSELVDTQVALLDAQATSFVLGSEIDETAKRLSLVQTERDESARNLALVRTERDTLAKKLALADEAIKTAEAELLLARTKIDETAKFLATSKERSALTEEELAKKKTDVAELAKKIADAQKQADDLQQLMREKEKLRAGAMRQALDLSDRLIAAEMKLRNTEKQVDDLTAKSTDKEKLRTKVNDLEKQIADANVAIVDLQGVKAKLADKINKLETESEQRFAGIVMSGKKVVFLVDMSGSMDRTDENTPNPDKWPTVRDTLIKVMRTIPDLDQYQVILFSSKVSYALGSEGQWLKYEREKSIEQVRKAMTAIKPVADTNLYAAFDETFKFRAKGLDTVYLFSDGLPTSGAGLTPTEDRTITGETERGVILARHLRKMLRALWNAPSASQARVRINSIGFFYESPDVGAFLWALSRENDGSFVGMSKP